MKTTENSKTILKHSLVKLLAIAMVFALTAPMFRMAAVARAAVINVLMIRTQTDIVTNAARMEILPARQTAISTVIGLKKAVSAGAAEFGSAAETATISATLSAAI